MAATCEQLTAADVQSLAALQHLSAPVSLADAATDQPGAGAEAGTKGRRLSALAYTGEPVARSFGTMVVDLSTVRLSDKRNRLPMLMRHSTGGMCDELQDSRLGHWDSIKLSDSGIYLAGELYDKPLANQVLEDARKGYPWEISVGLTDGSFERIPAGEKRTVNGRELVGTPTDDWGAGGTYILRNARLREASLVEIGADPNTEASFQLSAARPAPSANFKQRAMQRFHAILAGLGIPASTVREALDLDLDSAGVMALAAPSSEDPHMSTPATPAPAAPVAATIEQLEALPGAEPGFVLEALKAKLSIGDASQKLLAAMAEKLAAAEKARDEAAALAAKGLDQLKAEYQTKLEEAEAKLAAATRAGGAPAVEVGDAPAKNTGDVPAGMKRLSGLSGTDPESDWTKSQELQAYWKDRGGHKAFLRYASMCKTNREDYTVVVDD